MKIHERQPRDKHDLPGVKRYSVSGHAICVVCKIETRVHKLYDNIPLPSQASIILETYYNFEEQEWFKCNGLDKLACSPECFELYKFAPVLYDNA